MTRDHLPVGPAANVISEGTMPGTLASVTLSGRGFNQRSGLHSCASGPHTRVFVFAEVMAILMLVPFSTGTELRCVLPSAAIIGNRSGMTSSQVALERVTILVRI